MSDFIPLSVPVIKGNEWTYIKDCLDTGWVSSAGKYVERFEEEIAFATGSKHAVACMNGTAALHISLILAGVKAEDEVILPSLTFIAPVNAVHYLNAHPIFMDCDDYYNLDAEKTIDFILNRTEFRDGVSINKRSRRRVKAVIPVHVFGNAVMLDKLAPLCRERNIRLVEDATESLGTIYTAGAFAGKATGTVGEIGCLSFNGNKIITTGGGGMLLTDDPKLAAKARYLTNQAKDDEVRYIHDEVGYNYRMTNLQAAMGVAQLEQFYEYLQIKKKNYDLYRQAITDIHGLTLASVPNYARNNLWMYALRIDNRQYGKDREGLMASLAQQRIQTRPVWYLNHLQKPYRYCEAYHIEKAPRLWEITLNIPASVDLTEENIETVILALKHG